VIWWLRVRRAHSVLAPSAGAFLLLMCLVRDNDIALPAFSLGADNDVALAFFPPLIVVGAVGHCLDSRLASAEPAGLRPVRWMDTALVVAATGVVVGGAAAAGAFLDSAAAAQAGRNAAFLTGLLLLGRGFTGRSAVVLPVAWVFVVVFFGRASAHSYHGWAVTGQAASSGRAAAVTAAVFAAGVVVNHYLSRKAP
jgi:hypothetical protein